LPLSLGCRPEMSSPEKQSKARVLLPDARAPVSQPKSPPQLCISQEQRQSLSAVISMRLAELHHNLMADHDRILALQAAPTAGPESQYCMPAFGRKLPTICAAGPVSSSTQTNGKGPPPPTGLFMEDLLGNSTSDVAQGRSHHPNLAFQGIGPDTRKGGATGGIALPESKTPGANTSKKRQGLFEFSNTDAIKEKVRNSKLKPNAYHVHNAYYTTGFFQWLAKHPLFENVTLSIIVINALWISFDTDGNTAETIIQAETVYVFADVMFFVYFSIELFVRFMAFKRKQSCLKDGWFMFDTTLVSLYAFDPFTIGLLAALQGGGGLSLPTAVLRLFRLARLSRLVRMLRSLPELMIMIKGMLSAAASVGYTLGLLLLITYVFSIALRNLVPPDSEIETVYFSSVPEAMHSLIIFGTFLDNLSDFILALKDQSPPCFCLTWLYISLASLTVMNMLIGVLCEVISAVAAGEKEGMMVDRINEMFGKIVQELDKNNDGTLSWDEFQKILEFPEALKALESVNIDPESMVDMAEDFFFEDSEPVAVTFDEFMKMVLDLRGGQQATVQDIMGLGKRFNKRFMMVKEQIDNIATKIARLHKPQVSLLGSADGQWESLAEMQEAREVRDGTQLEFWQGYCRNQSVRTFTHICRVTGHCSACGQKFLPNARVGHYECECCGTLPYCEKCNGGVDPDLVRKTYLKQKFQ